MNFALPWNFKALVIFTLLNPFVCHSTIGEREKYFTHLNSTEEEEAYRSNIYLSNGKVKCPPVYDGQHCWPETPANTVAALPCTGEYGEGGTGLVKKLCDEKGKWNASNSSLCYENQEYGREENERQETRSNSTTSFAFEVQMTNRYAQLVALKACQCLQIIRSQPLPPNNGLEYCPSTFDGWSCWNYTRAGETAYISCPEFISGFDPNRFAHKICKEDGTWFKHPENNEIWSNYTTCIDLDDLLIRQIITKIYISGYSISVLALTLSLAIFFFFRSLKCTRIKIHKNLFISFVISNILWIIWYIEVTENVDIVLANPTECQILHIFTQYFLVASYFWMFMEGLYLHTLLVFAFIAEEKLMRWFYLLGWGFPALLITAYAAVRSSSEDDSKDCWMEESIHTWILSAPVCASMLTNLCFLINIVRVLVTKLRSNNILPDTQSTRKAVRATLILIPLLGLHYVVMPFRPEKGAAGELVYQIVSAIVTSFQGFCVALLFCFFNSEVLAVTKKKWNQYKFMHDPRRYSPTTAYATSVNGISGATPSIHNRLYSPASRTFTPPREVVSTDGSLEPKSNQLHLRSLAAIIEADPFNSNEVAAEKDSSV